LDLTSQAIEILKKRNKYMSLRNKITIYKTCVRSIMTHAIERRTETTIKRTKNNEDFDASLVLCENREFATKISTISRIFRIRWATVEYGEIIHKENVR